MGSLLEVGGGTRGGGGGVSAADNGDRAGSLGGGGAGALPDEATKASPAELAVLGGLDERWDEGFGRNAPHHQRRTQKDLTIAHVLRRLIG